MDHPCLPPELRALARAAGVNVAELRPVDHALARSRPIAELDDAELEDARTYIRARREAAAEEERAALLAVLHGREAMKRGAA